ncbi:MAG: PD40 domain-containing protein [Ignavibacteriae bacterium]|nr:PD40 domain-containing protein [Ignavibacteriota bacterium]
MNKHSKSILIARFSFLFFAMLLAPSLHAQEYYQANWSTIETEHFYVHFHEGAERTGKVVAKIAEEIYGPITSLYNHKPDQKVSWIIKDYDDYSNGAAYFYDNKVEIWAPNMDFDFRGTHNWLRNVITHEFTHIVQIQTTMKFGRRMPGFYLQWLGYESERRPDVLYGYPNVIASYPISGFLVPAWFAEGVAQYNRPQLRYDFWDSHRDMILRSYALKDSLLTWNQMSVFGKTSLGNESSYNAGFAFVDYIARKYGIEKLEAISRNLGSLGAMSIDGAIEKAVGKPGEVVYNEWRDELKQEYNRRVAPIRAELREGNPVTFVDDESAFKQLKPEEQMKSIFGNKNPQVDVRAHVDQCALFQETGFANLHASWSPDGKRLAYLSGKSASYLGQTGLFVSELGGKEKLLQSGVHSRASWSPDGTKLYYERQSRNNKSFLLRSDLYVYDIAKEDETRLTFGQRLMTPAMSPDGKQIACIITKDGTTNLAVINPDGSGLKVITAFANGEQVYLPEWSPSGDRIVFDYSVKDGRDIAWIRPDGTDMEFLVTGDDDSRAAAFSPDGAKLYFASDRTGIFNIYTFEIATKAIAQVTNVLGGAFMPTINKNNELIYSGYTHRGYKFYLMKNDVPVPQGEFQYLPTSRSELTAPRTLLASTGGSVQEVDWQALRSYDDTKIPLFTDRSYKSVFTSLSFVPFIRVDNYNKKNTALDAVKLGVYAFSSDVLDKLSLFAGAAFNKKLERDLFLQFTYLGELPLFHQIGLAPASSIELYNVTRKTDNFIALPDRAPVPVDVTYNLFEFDVVLTQKIFSPMTALEFRYAHSRYTSTIETFTTRVDENSPTQLVSGSDDLYLIANDLSLKFTSEMLERSSTGEINPVGRKISFRIGRELNKFNGDGQYEVGSTGLVPVYKTVNFTRVEMNWREYIPFFFKNHTLAVKARGGSILEHTVDNFFDFYAGGLVGMKGYPFYAIGGNEMAVFGLEYRFPLVANIDVRFLQFYFDKLYASVYGDFGNAWSSGKPQAKDFKADVGAEIRLESFSWYAYPTRIFFNASYGLNQFQKIVRNAPVTYGKEWRFYFGVLFGFDFD